MLQRSRLTLLVIFVLACLGMQAGCTKTTTEKEYVARVGDALLTREEIARAREESADHLRRQYVSNWVTSEMLYQEAKRKGFGESDEVLRAIEETKRQLTVNAYLEGEIYADTTGGVTEQDILDEFNNNRSAYRLHEDVVNMSFALFAERDAANSLRSKILRGATWSEALRSVESDADARAQLIRFASNGYFTQALLYPEELWKMARTLSREDVSYVVRTSAGHVVALVHGVKKQGEMPELDFAKNEIRERLLIRERNRKYDELLTKLRTKYEVDVRFNTTDSAGIEVQKR